MKARFFIHRGTDDIYMGTDDISLAELLGVHGDDSRSVLHLPDTALGRGQL